MYDRLHHGRTLIGLIRYAEIEQTLELEKENAKSGWRELVGTAGMTTYCSFTIRSDGHLGMRKRILICSFLGLATQWSGNGLTSSVF